MKRGGNVCCNICKTGEINQANTGNSREGEEKLNESKRWALHSYKTSNFKEIWVVAAIKKREETQQIRAKKERKKKFISIMTIQKLIFLMHRLLFSFFFRETTPPRLYKLHYM